MTEITFTFKISKRFSVQLTDYIESSDDPAQIAEVAKKAIKSVRQVSEEIALEADQAVLEVSSQVRDNVKARIQGKDRKRPEALKKDYKDRLIDKASARSRNRVHKY